MDSTQLIIFSIVLVFIFIGLIVSITSVITLWKLFAKAGQPGWAAIVPIYNYVIMAKVGKRPAWLGVLTGVTSMLSLLLSIYMSFFAPYLAASSDSSSSIYLGLTLLSFLLSSIVICLFIYILIGCMQKYENGVMIWLLYWLLPFIAVFLVNKARYIGNGDPVPLSNNAYYNTAASLVAAPAQQQQTETTLNVQTEQKPAQNQVDSNGEAAQPAEHTDQQN